MVKHESDLFAGERTFADEKVEYRLLCPNEPDIEDDKVAYKPLPPAKICPEGTGGNWWNSPLSANESLKEAELPLDSTNSPLTLEALRIIDSFAFLSPVA